MPELLQILTPGLLISGWTRVTPNCSGRSWFRETSTLGVHQRVLEAALQAYRQGRSMPDDPVQWLQEVQAGCFSVWQAIFARVAGFKL